MANELEQMVLKKAQAWLDGHYDEETKKQVKYLMDNDMKELVESFYKDLEFGTGGLRGIMGVGTNRMPRTTPRSTTATRPTGPTVRRSRRRMTGTSSRRWRRSPTST